MPGGAVIVGYTGKLPALGDFVRVGLPRRFTDPWDEWWQRSLAGIRQSEGWTEAWLEAPVWRFHLGGGACGAEAVRGLWMPSVDRVGRYFPLTLAAVGAVDGLSGGFLDALEQAGRTAISIDLAPDALTPLVEAAVGGDGFGDEVAVEDGASLWWTEGAPRVPATRFGCQGLPDGTAFAAMLDASS